MQYGIDLSPTLATRGEPDLLPLFYIRFLYLKQIRTATQRNEPNDAGSCVNLLYLISTVCQWLLGFSRLLGGSVIAC
jgi:hypothetical protein